MRFFSFSSLIKFQFLFLVNSVKFKVVHNSLMNFVPEIGTYEWGRGMKSTFRNRKKMYKKKRFFTS